MVCIYIKKFFGIIIDILFITIKPNKRDEKKNVYEIRDLCCKCSFWYLDVINKDLDYKLCVTYVY